MHASIHAFVLIIGELLLKLTPIIRRHFETVIIHTVHGFSTPKSCCLSIGGFHSFNNYLLMYVH